MISKTSNPFQLAVSIGTQVLNRQRTSIDQYREVQKQTLLSILQANSETEYGTLHRFSDISSCQEYASRVPLSTYRVYKPYVNRMIQENARNLLCAEPLTGFALTSATSGNMKYIPQNKTMGMAYIQEYVLRGLAMTAERYVLSHGRHLEQGYVLVLTGNPIRYSKSDNEHNLPVSGVNGIAISQVADEMKLAAIPPVQLLTADIGIDMNYLYLRLALQCRDIVHAISIYDDYVVAILRYLNQNWRVLCDEIETGRSQFSSEMLKKSNLDNSDLYAGFLKPDPVRAQELRDILEDGVEEDSLHRIWPDLQILSAATKKGQFMGNSGLKRYLKGIAHDCSPYGATEGLFGVAVEPGDDRIQLLPHLCYYEFIPASAMMEENPKTLTMDQLKDGELYELVITTRAGLYRYRIGDLLRVTGFYRSDIEAGVGKMDFPLFSFEGRKGIGIDLVSEKSPESALRNALTVAAVKCRISVNACCMYGEDGRFESADPLQEEQQSACRYVVQFESKKELSDGEMEAFAKEIDHQICSVVKSYEAARKTGALLALRAQQLPEGAFRSYEEEMRSKSANPSQYKRCFIMKIG